MHMISGTCPFRAPRKSTIAAPHLRPASRRFPALSAARRDRHFLFRHEFRRSNMPDVVVSTSGTMALRFSSLQGKCYVQVCGHDHSQHTTVRCGCRDQHHKTRCSACNPRRHCTCGRATKARLLMICELRKEKDSAQYQGWTIGKPLQTGLVSLLFSQHSSSKDLNRGDSSPSAVS